MPGIVEMMNLQPYKTTPIKQAEGSLDPIENQIVWLFRQRAEAAVRIAFHLTRDHEAALDISQDAFVKAIQSIPALEDPARLSVWFHRIVVNLCRDWIKRQQVERKALSKAVSHRVSTNDASLEMERKESADQIQTELLKLPLDYREAVILVCVEELTPKDAAQVLGIPDGTLRSRLHEGRKMLRELLGAEQPEER